MAEEKQRTEYTILRKHKPTPVERATAPASVGDAVAATPLYEVVGTRQASSSAHAIRSWLHEKKEPEAGVYVAVPSRSFQPQTVGIETQTKLTIT